MSNKENDNLYENLITDSEFIDFMKGKFNKIYSVKNDKGLKIFFEWLGTKDLIDLVKYHKKFKKEKKERGIKEIAQNWNWDNLDYKWTILEGAYCRLSWVTDALCNQDSMIDDEYKDILNDTLELIEALQKIVKTKL